MKYNSELHILQKSALGAVAIILSTVLAFGTLIQSVKASELSKTETVKTDYALGGNQSFASNDNFEIDYTVVLEEGSPKADENAVSAAEAAKIGVKDLKRIFGINTTGKTISMYYCPVGETSVRAEWFGNVIDNGDIDYYFSVDAITGDIATTCRDITLNKSVNLGFDQSLENDSSEYNELAKKVVKDYNVLPEEIDYVKYASQGYAGDNPNIQIIVVDKKGNEAQISFSRYDKELLQICYDNWVKMTKLLDEKMEQFLDTKFSEQQSVDASEAPANTLIPLK